MENALGAGKKRGSLAARNLPDQESLGGDIFLTRHILESEFLIAR